MNAIGSRLRRIFHTAPNGQTRPPAKSFGDKFARGTEQISDIVNIATGSVLGGGTGMALGALAVQGTATALGVAGTAMAAPLGLGLAVAAGALVTAGIGAYAGFRAGKWVTKKAGAVAEKLLGKTVGEDKARAVGKGALALLASAPFQVTLGAVALGGTVLTAAGQAANGAWNATRPEQSQEYLLAR